MLNHTRFNTNNIYSFKSKKEPARMTRYIEYKLAVPQTKLLDSSNSADLAFLNISWRHLDHYVSLVNELPENLPGITKGLQDIVERMKKQAKAFGVHGSIVLNKDGEPPKELLPQIYWLILKSHSAVLDLIHELEFVREQGKAGNSIVKGLNKVSNTTIKAREAVSPMLHKVMEFKDRMLPLNAEFNALLDEEILILQNMQEQCGAYKAERDIRKKELDSLSVFSFYKKDRFVSELNNTEHDLNDTLLQSQVLRASIAKLEDVSDHGVWLEKSCDDLIEFLDQLRVTWTHYASNISQFAADSANWSEQEIPKQLEILGISDAVEAWNHIADAMQRFLTQVDDQ